MSLKINYKGPEWAAAFSAMISGVAAHAFGLVNILHNYDNILQQPKGYGAGITSGRWLLEILGDLNDAFIELNYNLPTMNGLFFLLLIAVSAAFMVNFLKIRNPVSAVLTGCLMATFPTVCATLVFRYTAPYYGISLLLSVLAAWVLEKGKFGFLISALCLSFSMGIYQAYPPFTISLLVLALMRDSLREDAQLLPLIRRGIYYCVTLALGVILYFVFLKISQAVYSVHTEVVLDSYQGIDSMGKLSLAQLPGLIKRAWLSAALFPLKDYCGLAAVKMLKVLWLLLILTILVQIGYILLTKKTKPLMIAFCGLMGLLFPLAVNFIVVMAPEGSVYTIMVYSFVLVGCAPLVFLESMPDVPGGKQGLFSRILAVLIAGIVLYNGYYANVNYNALYYSNQQVVNFVSSLMVQVRMTDGYTPEKEWVFVGEPDRFAMWDVWYEVPYYGGFLGSNAHGMFNAAYSRDSWFASYLGSSPKHASEEAQNAMKQDPRVAEMPCWPAEGCIQVIDDFVVIKFQ